MNRFFRFINSKQALLLVALTIVSAILWQTHVFFKNFQKQEVKKMEILADAYVQFNKASNEEDISLLVKIIETNQSIPMIVTDDNGTILLDQNIPYTLKNKTKVLAKKLVEMKKTHAPIEINLSPTKSQYIYYNNSQTLNKLRYYPVALVVLFFLFLWIVYSVLNITALSEKNKLWTGMAKETAHQIGTPLSSLLGWVEILRTENIDQSYVDEIEKDVAHLNTIASRFSKIGSIPTLSPNNPSKIILETISYFKARSSKNIRFHFTEPTPKVAVNFNKDLLGWVLENLIKNAIDAMSGKGDIYIKWIDLPLEIQIFITDTGKGIPKSLQKKIFEPGYTTKDRGWGLGLSLSRRIITKYHNGKIFVKHSQKEAGTTFQINLPKT